MKYKTITVEWMDAASLSRWHSEDELPTPEKVTTSGFLIKKTRKFIVVCGSCGDDKEETFGDCIAIPSPWIIKK